MENRAKKIAIFRNERVTGIEPVSLDWQPNVIATIRYPLFYKFFVPDPRVELGTQGFSVLRSTAELIWLIF